MGRCAIVGEQQMLVLMMRYNGIGTQLTNDEREILMLHLVLESEAHGGLAAEAKKKCDTIADNQRSKKK